MSTIEEGGQFEVGSTSDKVLEGYDVAFAAVAPARRTELLTYAS